ncbi:hypothetical protein [Vibrio jasicida]|uniref:hypothetical protein n=1 Tax=Vibrio jasicida TaxID=766224 RepID=UPI000CE4A44A|nr:hypothetical protein [Vibrio jasicida]
MGYRTEEHRGINKKELLDRILDNCTAFTDSYFHVLENRGELSGKEFAEAMAAFLKMQGTVAEAITALFGTNLDPEGIREACTKYRSEMNQVLDFVEKNAYVYAESDVQDAEDEKNGKSKEKCKTCEHKDKCERVTSKLSEGLSQILKGKTRDIKH